MIDMNKTYKTRDGRPVRLLCVDGNSTKYPVIGFIGNSSFIIEWTSDGEFISGEGDNDYGLIEVKPKVVVEKCYERHVCPVKR